MPKEYTNCVRAAMKKGVAGPKAKGMCAAVYFKKHGKTVQQAHDEGIEEFDDPTVLRGLPEEAELREMNSVLLEVDMGAYPIAPIMEEGGGATADRPFRYRGTALVDNIVSKNEIFYSQEFNNLAMERTNAAIKDHGTVVTVFGRHGQAFGVFGMSQHLPIGKVDRLFREGDRIMYDATLAGTREGVDAAHLIKGGFVNRTSLRIYKYESVPGKIGEQDVEVMKTAVLAGIDLCEVPGIEGAGIESRLEEAPQIIYRTEGSEEMEWKDVTVEALKANAGLVVEQLVLPLQEAMLVQKKEIEKQTARVAEMDGQLTAAAAKVAELTLSLAVSRAAHNPLTALAAEKLARKVTKAEEITEELRRTVAEEARNDILGAVGGLGPAGTGLQGNPQPKPVNVMEDFKLDCLRLA